MEALDLKKIYKSLYTPAAGKMAIVDVPELSFVMIDGAIEPHREPGTSPLFQENTQAMYAAAYTLKFMLKQRPQDAVDYPVMALEGLWWVADGVFNITVKDNWLYTLMILVPDLVTPAVFAEALAQLRKKKGHQPAFERLYLERFREGLCAQAMHIGPYAGEPATLEKMHQFMEANGYRDALGLDDPAKRRTHHEIYLGDPRKAAPDRLKTVLRHPVTR